MPDRPDILSAEKVQKLAYTNQQLARSHELLREQRDEIRAEAKRQFQEWAEHLRACGRQCEAAEARLARVTAAAEYVRDARDIEDVDDAHLTNALDRLEEALADVEEPAE